MKSSLLTIALVFALHCAGRAGMVLLDMEGPPVQGPDTQVGLAQYLEDGFQFKPKPPDTQIIRNGGGASAFYPRNGGKYLQVASTTSLVISQVDGGAFDAISVDLAEYSTGFTSPATIRFRGFQADNTFADVAFITDGIIDGPGPLADFQTFMFPSSFLHVVRIESLNRTYSLDNLLVVTPPIPEPGTLLGGIAVAAFIVTRRRLLC